MLLLKLEKSNIFERVKIWKYKRYSIFYNFIVK